MRTFAKNYPEIEFVQEALAQIPWYHNIAIFEKIKESTEREWYIYKTVEHGWSRNILVHQIESYLTNLTRFFFGFFYVGFKKHSGKEQKGGKTLPVDLDSFSAIVRRN